MCLSCQTATVRLAAAEAFLDGIPADAEVVIVGASRDAADELARRVALRRRAAVGLHRFTLTQLAARLAAPASSASGLAPCTPLGAHAVAARAAFDALAAGRIPYFEPVARTPGFTLTLAATLAELRGAGVDAAALAASAAPADQLAAILAGYEAQLAAAGLADRAALFAAATAAVGDSPTDPLIGLPLLLLDVPLDSRCERDFAARLVEAAPRTLATVPAGEPSPWVGDAAPRRPTAAPANSLARLQTYLFAEGEPPAAEPDDSLQLFSAPGEGREAVEIARRVLAEARAGTPFDRMAVFLRNPETYASLLEAAFRRAGVPAWFARGSRRPNPAGRAFLALLACAAEQLSAQRFAEYLSLAQVPRAEAPAAPWAPPQDEAFPTAVATPDATPTDDTAPETGVLASPWKWESLLVEAAVIGGSERWARRLAGLDAELALRQSELQSEEPDAPGVAGLERARAQLAELRRFAMPLIERLAALPARASWAEWLAALDELAVRALRAPTGVRAVLGELAPMATVGPVGLDEVRDVLAARLTTLSDDPPADRYGRLLITTLDDARGRSAEVVFLPGVAERLFPQRPREDPLLLDGARAALSPELPTQEARLGRERLRLRLGVGAAARRIVISYPRADVIQGRPRVISFYGLDVARAARGTMPDVERFEREVAAAGDARLAWPAPSQPADAIDAAEHDLATIAGILHTPAAKRTKGAVQYLLDLNPHLGRSLRTRYARWENRPWSALDGLTAPGAEALDRLAKQRLGERPYSPSALQHFAACPYRFFLAAIQRLEPRLEAAPLEQLDPLTRGKLIHRVQADTLRALAAAGTLPLTSANVAAAERQLADTLTAVAAREEEVLAPPIPRIWNDEIAALRGDLVTWLRQLAERGDAWQPLYVEYGFGLPADPSRDPASRRTPAVVGDGLQLRGSVDLVERHADGSVRVIDHKTGADRTQPGLIVGGGEVLQPVLYALAVEAALGVPVRDARLSFCTSRGGFSERVVPFDPRSRTAALDVLAHIDRAIATGRFHPAPREGACAHCDFRPVCGPYEEERVARKDPLPELAALRNRP
ncbi:MAG TPA: PD-(D/E)XK nuclease family protein [Candidatus Dormibacteraeota bacterium]|nr:PD-(D/E)XK nuclease family protein [Candidatus Dormibacteraeota bacterium]